MVKSKRNYFEAFMILFLVIKVQEVKGELVLYAYKLECGNATAPMENVRCGLRVVGRAKSTITILVDVTEPINFLQTTIAAVWKTSANSFRNTVFNGTFEACTSMDNMPPLLKLIFPLVDKFAPGVIHDCPYIGKDIGVKDLAIDTSLIPVIAVQTFAKGEYRIDTSFYNKNKETLFWNKLYIQVSSKSYSKIKKKNETETEPKN